MGQATACAWDAETGRTLAGVVNVCPDALERVLLAEPGGDGSPEWGALVDTVAHEALHLLAFSEELYPKFRPPAATLEGCLDHRSGGGERTAHGRPALLNVARTDIAPFNAAVWSPERAGLTSAALSGGGQFGPQYAYEHAHADTYRGELPYTEWIELGVAEPVSIFSIVIGLILAAAAYASKFISLDTRRRREAPTIGSKVRQKNSIKNQKKDLY